MSCRIINPAHATINGGSKAYGGGLTSAALKIGGLKNGGSTANITLEGEQLTHPKSGDSMTLTILSMSCLMDIASYSMNRNATSINTLTLNLVDRSHRYLDKQFIGLRGEIPEGVPHVHALGFKFGTKPNDFAIKTLGYNVSEPDTQWVDIEAYLASQGQSQAAARAASSPGKALYWYSGRYSLLNAMEGLLLGGLPAGPYDATGSFRDVLSQIQNETGYIMYWDLEKNKVKIFNGLNSAGGKSALSRWNCNVLSTTDSVDFTTTETRGAIGKFSSNYSAQDNQEGSSGRPMKYYVAELLDPDFHYKGCGKETAPLTVIDFEDANVQKAIGASYDHKVYGFYVLQSLLSKAQDFVPWVDEFQADVGEVRGDGAAEFTTNLFENFKNPGMFGGGSFPNWDPNTFFEDYYYDNASYPCRSDVAAVELHSDGELCKTIFHNEASKAEGWDSRPGKFPNLVGGQWTEKLDGADRTVWDFGTMFIHQPGSTASILNTSGEIDAQGDVMRNYLQQLTKFKNNFYVVTSCFGNGQGKCKGIKYYYETDPITGKSKRKKVPSVKGFLTTAKASAGAENLKDGDGYEIKSINPWAPLKECGLSSLVDLASTLLFMYKKGTCKETFLEVPVVFLIEALYNNTLKEFFEGYAPGAYEKPAKASDDLNIHLGLRTGLDEGNPFATTDVNCAAGGEINSYSVSGPAVVLTNLYGKITISADADDPFGVMFGGVAKDLTKNLVTGNNVQNTDKILNLMLITDNLISPHIKGVDISSTNTQKEIKIWFSTEATGQFDMSYGNFPNDGPTQWKRSLNTGLSITAADVGMKNEQFNEAKATAANRFDAYSSRNRSIMYGELRTKVDSATYVDSTLGESSSLTALLTKENNVTIPSFEQGLEGVSISSTAKGESTVTIDVGNSAVREAQRALRESIAMGVGRGHAMRTALPTSSSFVKNVKMKNILE